MKEPPKRWRGKQRQAEPVHVVVEPTPVVCSPTISVPPLPPARVEQSRSMILATVVMALTSVVMVFVTYRMVTISHHQWEAMREQVEQTDDVIRQMKADHMAARDEATAVIEQMKADHAVVREQIRQNNEVLEQMRLEQRAWVDIAAPRIELEADKELQWMFQFRNTGKTPALVRLVEYQTVLRPLLDDFDPYSIKLVESQEEHRSLGPSGAINIPIRYTPAITQTFYDSIKGDARTHALYIVGKIHYVDVMNVQRQTEFCFVYDARANEVRAHPKHNRMM